MAKATLAPGALPALDKELIALAVGVASRCDAGIGFHVKALIRMGGGPTLMHAAEAVRAYEEFTATKSASRNV